MIKKKKVNKNVDEKFLNINASNLISIKMKINQI